MVMQIVKHLVCVVLSICAGIGCMIVGSRIIEDTYRGLDVSSAELGARVRALRIERHGSDKTSIKDMADDLGISPDTLQNIEDGKVPVADVPLKALQEKYPDEQDLLLGKVAPLSTLSVWVWFAFGFISSQLIVEGWLRNASKRECQLETVGAVQNMVDKITKSLPGTVDRVLDSNLRGRLAVTLSEILGDRIYEGIRASHIELLDQPLKRVIDEIMEGGKAGIRFVGRMSPGDYATLSLNLDEVCSSQSACNLFSPYALFTDSNVEGHLSVTNKRAAMGPQLGMKVVRVQVITLNNIEDFRSPRDAEHVTRYNSDYRKARGVNFSWVWDTDIAGSYAVQDHLVYDHRLVLLYDSMSHLLELNIGGTVDEYIKVFSAPCLRPSTSFDDVLSGKIKHPGE